MDIETFYGHMERLRSKGYVPYLTDTGEIRFRHPDGHFCPLTAVCHLLTGKGYSPNRYHDAAFDMRLPIENEACWIKVASDRKKSSGIRIALLQKLELEEAA